MKKKTLLLGNGIYRAFHGDCESWESVLKDMSKKLNVPVEMNPNVNGNISFIQYFEYLFALWLSKNKSPDNCQNASSQRKAFMKKIQDCLFEMYEGENFKACSKRINSLVWSKFDTVLTTNIDNRLEKFVGKDESAAKFDDCGVDCEIDDSMFEWSSKAKKKWMYSTYRSKSQNIDGVEKKIFYMHGDLSKPNSICFGLDHYLGEYRCLYDCLYAPGKEKPELLKLLDASENLSKSECENDSWLSYFFFSDVDIIGQSLSRDELDIWWAIEKRFQYQLIRETCGKSSVSKPQNRIRYIYPSLEEDKNSDKLKLLKSMNVDTVVIPADNYMEFYKEYFNFYA